jgi:glycosyltransferase involved in cell wall biosynthesis
MPSAKKLFTIALPVRNGGEHLKECVASILAQRLGDFDLAVLENASTDGTAEWLKELKDPRVTVLPAEKPLSIEENWARILHIPKNEFLTTIGHDDLLDPDFLEIIQRLIGKYPDASLYLTHFRLIDAKGRFIRHCLPMPSRETAAEYLAARLCWLRYSYGTGHVMRSADYDAFGGIPTFAKLLSADDALFMLAIGNSYRATAMEEAFSYRGHPASMSGGSSGRENFEGLETYADFLMSFQKKDPAIAEILRRHFGNCAQCFGQRWIHEELIATKRTRDIAERQIHQRIQLLVNRFGGENSLTNQGNLTTRLQNRAENSKFYHTIYRFWNKISSLKYSRYIARLFSGPIV